MSARISVFDGDSTVVVAAATAVDGEKLSSLLHPGRFWWCSRTLLGRYRVHGNVADVPRPWWSLAFGRLCLH